MRPDSPDPPDSPDSPDSQDSPDSLDSLIGGRLIVHSRSESSESGESGESGESAESGDEFQPPNSAADVYQKFGKGRSFLAFSQQLLVFAGFRVLRMRPSRQVSIEAAHASL